MGPDSGKPAETPNEVEFTTANYERHVGALNAELVNCILRLIRALSALLPAASASDQARGDNV
jgi:hypothetical protein